MKTFKTRDLFYGEKELVKHAQYIHFEPTENGRIVFEIKHLSDDTFQVILHADKIIVGGDHDLYVW